MNKLCVMSLALSAAVMSLAVPSASAELLPASGPTGPTCGYRTTSDPAPDAPADAMTGTVNAGPLTWDRSFTVTCSVQVDDSVHNGTSNDVARESAASVPAGAQHVAVLEPRVVNYLSPENAQDYLCTSVTHAGGTLYWTTTGAPGGGMWSTSPMATCPASTQFSTGPIIDAVNDLVVQLVDPALCAVLAQLHALLFHNQAPGLLYIDDEGDVFLTADGSNVSEGNWRDTLFWDCPGYVDFDSDPYGVGDDGTPVIDP